YLRAQIQRGEILLALRHRFSVVLSPINSVLLDFDGDGHRTRLGLIPHQLRTMGLDNLRDVDECNMARNAWAAVSIQSYGIPWESIVSALSCSVSNICNTLRRFRRY